MKACKEQNLVYGWKDFHLHLELSPKRLDQGPVVQSIVSLTSLLRNQLVKCWFLYNQIHWYFLLKNWEKLLQCKSFKHFFNKKYWHIWDINIWNFNKMLTNAVVCFEHLRRGGQLLTICLLDVPLLSSFHFQSADLLLRMLKFKKGLFF